MTAAEMKNQQFVLATVSESYNKAKIQREATTTALRVAENIV
jgi:hypothetical protein